MEVTIWYMGDHGLITTKKGDSFEDIGSLTATTPKEIQEKTKFIFITFKL